MVSDYLKNSPLDSCPPRIEWHPRVEKTLGDEMLDVAERAGLLADEHQRRVILAGGAVADDGKWATLEVAINEPRQNGKGAILEIRELWGLVSGNDKLVIHSAHQGDTALEHFERLLMLFESVPEFDRMVKRTSRVNGMYGITLTNGCRIRFRSRSKAGGRGFTCNLLVLDEAMFLPESFHGALVPTLRAQPNPQIWYAGSAVDQETHDHGIVFTRIRERGIARNDPSLTYFEWSLDYEHPNDVPPEVLADPVAWAACTPAFGDRIQEEHMKKEYIKLDARTFAVELCGVGDYPATDGSVDRMIEGEEWLELEDPNSVLADPVCLSFDVSAERRASIAACGLNADGNWHVEVIERRPGTFWIPERLAELDLEHSPLEIVCDGHGAAASLLQAIEAAGVNVRRTNSSEFADACARLLDAVGDKTLRHPGGQVLWNSIRAARTKPLSDRWAWSRRASVADISPLVAMTLALWSAQNLVTEDAGELAIY